MLKVALDGNRLRLGERLTVSLHRTLRIPDDGGTYPLPAGFGLFPLLALGGEDLTSPPEFVAPLYQREAIWLGFSAASWKPNAVKVIVGGINAVSGIRDDGTKLGEAQDYLVCPDQPWLDGINVGAGVIRQFVAMPMGQGYAIEAGLGQPEQGGIEIVAFEPLPGHFSNAPPARVGPMRLSRPAAPETDTHEMALGAGGRMRQKIYPDRYGRAVWDLDKAGRCRVGLINSRRWRELTGRDPPVTPIDTATYTTAGLPWFDLYDETEGTVAPDGTRRFTAIAERDQDLRVDSGDRPVDVSVTQIIGIDRGMWQDAEGTHKRKIGRAGAPTPRKR